jgi:hypothetical protein
MCKQQHAKQHTLRNLSRALGMLLLKLPSAVTSLNAFSSASRGTA